MKLVNLLPSRTYLIKFARCVCFWVVLTKQRAAGGHFDYGDHPSAAGCRGRAPVLEGICPIVVCLRAAQWAPTSWRGGRGCSLGPLGRISIRVSNWRNEDILVFFTFSRCPEYVVVVAVLVVVECVPAYTLNFYESNIYWVKPVMEMLHIMLYMHVSVCIILKHMSCM